MSTSPIGQHPTAAGLLHRVGGLRRVDGLRWLIVLRRLGLGTRQVIHREIVHGLEQRLHHRYSVFASGSARPSVPGAAPYRRGAI